MANNIAYAYQYFLDKGLSKAAAAGIVGNLKAESGVDPTRRQDPSYGPGMGIAQWSIGGRWDSLVAFAGKRSPTDLNVQLDFLWHELNTGYKHVLIELRNTNNVRHATAVFMKKFEIPADTSKSAVSGRTQLANDVYTGVKPGRVTVTASGSGGGAVNFNEKEFEDMLAAAGWSSALINEFPALKDKFKQAVKGKWEIERFIGAIKSTKWYQSRSDAMATDDALKENHHEQWVAQNKATLALLQDDAAAKGVSIPPKRLKEMAQTVNRFGLNDAQRQNIIAHEFKYKPNKPVGGEASTAIDQIQQVAQEWGVDVSNKRMNKMVRNILDGDMTIEQFNSWGEQQARDNYRHLADQFDKGMTLGQIASTYQKTMGDILEVNPDTIKLSDKRIQEALNYDTADGQGGKSSRTLAPMYAFTDALKKDPRWQVTKNAKEEYSGMAYKILQDFGVMA